jgi:HEAT repeat protein
MESKTMTDGPSGSETSTTPKKQPGLLQTSVRAIVVLVVCSAAIFWAYRSVWDSYHPLRAAAGRLNSGSPAQRVEAIKQLTDLGIAASGETIEALVPALHDPDAGVRAEAAQALGVVGSYAVRANPQDAGSALKALLESLGDPTPAVRVAALGALRILSGTTLSGGDSAEARGKSKAAAAEAPPTPVPAAEVAEACLKLLGDGEPDVQQAAIGTLGTIGPLGLGTPPKPLFDEVESRSATNRTAAIAALAGFPRGLDPLVPALLRHLEHDEPAVREACAQALARMRPQALSSAVVPDLLAGLKSPDRDVRMRIIALISRLSPDVGQVTPALIAVLKEPVDSDGRRVGPGMTITPAGPAHEAARALGQLAPGTKSAEAAIKALTEVVETGPDQRKRTAAEALSHFGPEAVRAVPALIKTIQETGGKPDPGGPAPPAAAALSRIAPSTPAADKAVAALSDALKSESVPTRQAAARALEHFGSAAAPALPALRELKDKDGAPNVREAASATLEAVKDKGAPKSE